MQQASKTISISIHGENLN